jgi:hypothetical protein
VVEHDLAKVGVEGSNPFARSKFSLKWQNVTKARCVSGLFVLWLIQLGFRHSPQNAFDFFHRAECIVRKNDASMAMDAGAPRTAPQRGGVKITPDNHNRKKFFSIFLGRPGYSAHTSLFRRM